MAAGMTKTQLVRHVAEKHELSNKQVAALIEYLAEVAIRETKKNGVFVVPGLGRLVKSNRKARIGRNPQTGEAIKIPAKTVVKFRVAKAVKDTIAPAKEVVTDLVVLAKAGDLPAFCFCCLTTRITASPRRRLELAGRKRSNTCPLFITKVTRPNSVNVSKRISLHCNDVGIGAGRDHADLALHVQHLRGTHRRRANCLHRGHAQLRHVAEFLRDRLSPRETTDVGAEYDLAVPPAWPS